VNRKKKKKKHISIEI